jgi:hypothetical protein
MAQKPILWLFIHQEIIDHSSHKVESKSNVESTTWKLKWKNESVKMQVKVHPSRVKGNVSRSLSKSRVEGNESRSLSGSLNSEAL